ncbi:MAG TPA: hypothetical protein VHY37_05705, partial [Tepidisphaeraceae bacterium]|nr:hypothetical protein [Tepidisphaeraceae bacterium]
MDRFHERFASIAPVLLPILLDAAIKGAALLLLTALSAWAMRRASAAARHLAWFLAVAALLFLPLFSVALPAWHILPNWANPPTAPRRGAAGGFSAASAAPETPPPDFG